MLLFTHASTKMMTSKTEILTNKIVTIDAFFFAEQIISRQKKLSQLSYHNPGFLFTSLHDINSWS